MNNRNRSLPPKPTDGKRFKDMKELMEFIHNNGTSIGTETGTNPKELRSVFDLTYRQLVLEEEETYSMGTVSVKISKVVEGLGVYPFTHVLEYIKSGKNIKGVTMYRQNIMVF